MSLDTYLSLYDIPSENANAPEKIMFSQFFKKSPMLIMGRGSEKFPVDVAMHLRNNDREVISRHHLRIVQFQSDQGVYSYRVEDMGALNGVFVNGIKIERHDLRNGDIIQVGGASGITIGTLLPSIDVSIKYKFHSVNTPNASVSNGHNSRKRSMGASDSIQNLKKPSQPNSTPSPLLSIGDQSSALHKQTAHYHQQQIKHSLSLKDQAIVTLELQLNDLHSKYTERESECSYLTTKLSKKEKVLQSLRERVDLLEKAEAQAQLQHGQGWRDNRAITNPVDSCSIDVSSLRSCLTCAICTFPLLDAVVMRCSHGFCRACLEHHLHQEKLGCLCPVCNDPPPRKLHVEESRPVLYVRSHHLDHLSWLLNEASGTREKLLFAEREKHSRAMLFSFGIDPDCNEWAGANQIDSQSNTDKKGKSKKGTSARTGATTSSDEEDEDDDADEDGNTNVAGEELVNCDYCGGRHEAGVCPHDDGTRNEDEEEEEDDGDDSQVEGRNFYCSQDV